MTSSSLETVIDQSPLETKFTILAVEEICEFLKFNILDSSLIFHFSWTLYAVQILEKVPQKDQS